MDSRSFCRCLLCTMHAFLLGTELKLADSEQKVSEEQWIETHGAEGGQHRLKQLYRGASETRSFTSFYFILFYFYFHV